MYRTLALLAALLLPLLAHGQPPSPVGGDMSNTTVTATGTSTGIKQADRAANVANIRDYGVKCDNATDDTAAIQAAVNLATPRVFRLPFRGTCLLSNTITITANGTGFVGEGGWWSATFRWIGPDGGTMFRVVPPTPYTSGSKLVQPFQLENATIQCWGQGTIGVNGAGNGIILNGVATFTLRRLFFSNCTNIGLWMLPTDISPSGNFAQNESGIVESTNWDNLYSGTPLVLDGVASAGQAGGIIDTRYNTFNNLQVNSGPKPGIILGDAYSNDFMTINFIQGQIVATTAPMILYKTSRNTGRTPFANTLWGANLGGGGVGVQGVGGVDGVTTSGSPNFSSVQGMFTADDVGEFLTSANYPANTTIVSVTDFQNIVLSANATASGTAQTYTLGRTITDATITSGSKVLTSATANFQCGANGDVGKAVLANTFLPSLTGILSCQSTTQVTLTRAATATTSAGTMSISTRAPITGNAITMKATYDGLPPIVVGTNSRISRTNSDGSASTMRITMNDNTNTPTLNAACGTGASLSLGSTNEAGAITLGTSPSTSCQLNFALTNGDATGPKVCMVADQSTTPALCGANTFAGNLIIRGGCLIAGRVLGYQCTSFINHN